MQMRFALIYLTETLLDESDDMKYRVQFHYGLHCKCNFQGFHFWKCPHSQCVFCIGTAASCIRHG